MLKPKPLIIILCAAFLLLAGYVEGQRKMEPLGRGTMAIRKNTSSVYVNWRIFAREFNNGTTYNLYRNNTLVASDLQVSNFVDETTDDGTYQVAAVVNGEEQALSPSVGVLDDGVIEVPIVPLADYIVPFAWPGDLDGDGEMELVINRIPMVEGKPCLVEAYQLDGTRMWQVDMGPTSENMDRYVGGAASISNGQNDGVTVYDLDADGTAG